MSGAFERAVARYRAKLAEISEYAETLGLDSELEDLVAKARRTEFRVSVLGRSKHGKSSVLNALIGEELVPTARLPCTCALIEIRRGTSLTFTARCDGRSESRSRENYLAEAAGAGARRDTPRVRWEVTSPREKIPPNVVLVDTPGTGNDPWRDEIAAAELERTDAALFVLNATQVSALDEIDALASLRARASAVIVLVNQVDRVPEDELNDLLDHARKRLARAFVPPERVLPFSAIEASRGAARGTHLLASAREALSETLLRNTAGSRLAALHQSTGDVLDRLSPRFDAAVAEREARAAHAAREFENSERALRDAKGSLAFIARIWEEAGASAAEATQDLAEQSWKTLARNALHSRSRWASEHDPVFSPKAFAEDIAEHAREALRAHVAKFMREKIEPVISGELRAVRRRIRSRIRSVFAATGAPAISEDRLLTEALRDEFGDVVAHASGEASEGAIADAVGAAVALASADVVVVAVLGSIGSFLAPALVAAGAVVGALTLAVKGRAWLREWLRDRVADSLYAKLSDDSVRERVSLAARDATRGVFVRLAERHERRLSTVVAAARKERTTHARALREASSELERASDAARRARKGLLSARAALAREQAKSDETSAAAPEAPLERACPRCGRTNRLPAARRTSAAKCGACRAPLAPALE